MSKLISIFDTITIPPGELSESSFSAIQLEGAFEHHLCKDAKERPLLLLSLYGDLYGDKMPNYALEHLRIDHGLRCRIVDQQGSPLEKRFTILRCLSSDRDIQEYFLRVVEMLFETLPEETKSSDFVEAIEKLVSLFSVMREPAARSVQGLWAELFFILIAKDPLTMLKAWHGMAMEEVDFSLGAERIELKSSGDGTRRHHFSMEQLNPPTDVKQLVASLFTESSGTGRSIKELWDDLRTVAIGDGELLFKIERICASTLGPGWQNNNGQRFDEFRARDSLLFFEPSNIPQISSDLPQGVSEVHFRSELDEAMSISLNEIAKKGELFSSCGNCQTS